MNRGNAENIVFNFPGKGKLVALVSDEIFGVDSSVGENLSGLVEGFFSGRPNAF